MWFLLFFLLFFQKKGNASSSRRFFLMLCGKSDESRAQAGDTLAREIHAAAPVDLLLVEWDLRQNGRFDYVFGLFCLISRIHQLATRIHQTRRDEDDQVSFDVLFCIVAEEAADEWDVA
jgi:hypothetical protein